MTPFEVSEMFRKENEARAADMEGAISRGEFAPEDANSPLAKFDAIHSRIRAMFDELRRTNATFRREEASWCRRCGGSGFDPEPDEDNYEAVPCYECGGTGRRAA